MPVNLFYPGDVAENLFRTARQEQQKKAVQSHSFQDGCRSSLLWRTFHFAFVSPVLHVNLKHWFHIPEFLESQDLEEDLSESGWQDYWNYEEGRMVDLDLGDASWPGQKIHALRMVWVPGGGCMDGFHGFYGKVFDRTDANKRVVAEIFSEENGEIRVQAADEIKDDFLDHENLKRFVEYLTKEDSVDPQHFCSFEDQPDQPSFLLAVALFMARHQDPMKLPHWADSTNILRIMLCLLGKYEEGSPNNVNVAARVLCGQDGHCRELIAAYAAEPYIPGNSAFTGVHQDSRREAGEQVVTLDNSMNWYTERLRWLAHALRCHQAGDSPGAIAALTKFCEEDLRLFRQDRGGIYSHIPSPDDLIKPGHGMFRTTDDVLDYLEEELKALTLGLENDLALFPAPPEVQAHGQKNTTPLKRRR